MKDSMKDQLKTLLERGDLDVSEKEKKIIKKEYEQIKNKDMSKYNVTGEETPIEEKPIEQITSSETKSKPNKPFQDIKIGKGNVKPNLKRAIERKSNTKKLLLIGGIIVAVTVGFIIFSRMQKKTN